MRSAVLNVSFVAFTLAMAASGIVAAYWFGQDALRRHLRRWASGSLWLTRRILNVEFEIRGLERFKDGDRASVVGE